jgi:hypothetical protein
VGKDATKVRLLTSAGLIDAKLVQGTKLKTPNTADEKFEDAAVLVLVY